MVLVVVFWSVICSLLNSGSASTAILSCTSIMNDTTLFVTEKSNDVSEGGTLTVLITYSLTMPKFPPPPPQLAQNRSGLSVGVTFKICPSY